MDFDLTGLIFLIFALVMGLTLHEFAHALVGHWLGDRTAHQEGRLSLNPVVHIDPFATLLLPLLLIIAGLPVFAAAKPVPFNPWALKYRKWGAAMVAFAGPLTNLLLAIFFALWLANVAALPDATKVLFDTIIRVNIALFVFNMLPIPPLDGSRIAYAAFPFVRDTFDRLERAGLMIIFLIVLLASPFIAQVIGGAIQLFYGIFVPSIGH